MNLAVSQEAPAFRFSTKARNLEQLQPLVQRSTVCDIYILIVGEWQLDRDACLQAISAQFGTSKLIVRSSATDEDSEEASMAGAFESCANIDPSDPDELAAAIDSVVSSYLLKDVADLDSQELLIQPMVADVALSGVLFTRDLGRNLPYFVVNYEESSRTDSITSGSVAGGQKTYRIHRGVDPSTITEPIQTIVEAAHEVERLVGDSALDVEFAMDTDSNFYLLQVRPLVRTQVLSNELLDRRTQDQISAMRELVAERLQPRPGLFGPTTILGEMPDWNPAEIIGTHPTPLAVSLYRHLIMASIWRQSRGSIGYLDPAFHQLLVTVGGRPYVDVRCSFNSLLPESLSDDLAERLVSYYVERLRENPEFHDKVEFEIVLSCHTFDPGPERQRLSDAGFSPSEIDELWASLQVLTDRVVVETAARSRRFAEDAERMAAHRAELARTPHGVSSLPFRIEHLLASCRSHGTLPFASAARCAFIAMSCLRSLVSRGVLTDEAFVEYTNSIDTVASAMIRDLDRFRSSEISLDEFLAGYGHLRPGTYDVRAYSYADRPDSYLSISADAEQGDRHGSASRQELRLDQVANRSEIQALLDEFDFTFDVDALDLFIKTSIREREWLKFEFSKNLSAALDLIAEFGRHHGMGRQDIAYLQIEELIRPANDSIGRDDIALLKRAIESRQMLHEFTSTLPLPDLIFSPTDVEVISDQRRKPNFVTQRTVVASMVRLESAADVPDDVSLAGKIVLIENADPGYDWLFSKDIAGLCTKYGGAASHMTIRCAEFGTPAAIGCGGQIFDELADADKVRLDCQQQIVEPYGA